MPAAIHHTHPEILRRLKRVEGQIRSIASMIEAGRSCVDVAQQFAAATSAIASAKDTFIRDHIDHCLNGSPDELEAQLLELKAITKYL
jgi:DNA-binding FrmR family transcriptional regulator